MKIGDTIRFGDYDWQVLSVDNDKALLITRYIIAQMPYHNTYEEVYWADSSIRAYLNSEFYNSFSLDDKEKICQVINENPDNSWYKAASGADTSDYIFLLSLEDVACRYFGDSSNMLHFPKPNQRYWFERKDINNQHRVAYLESRKNQVWWWWTRTTGRVGKKAVYVHGDGNIGIQGNNVLKGNVADGCCTGGVRPALWIKI